MVVFPNHCLYWFVDIYLIVVYVLIAWLLLECLIVVSEFLFWLVSLPFYRLYHVLYTLCFGHDSEQEDLVELLVNIFLGCGAVVTILKILLCACGFYTPP